MKKYLAAILAVTLLAVFLPGCSGEVAGPLSQTGSANFRLLVSDEPNDIGDFYSVNVTVSKIGVLSADTGKWAELNVSSTFDLTKLLGDNATVVWNGSIASGNYTKVFIYVDNVTGILSDNSSGTPMPSGEATVKLPSGKLQISKPFSVNQTSEGSMVNFVFDITIIKAGQSGKYILKPQIGESGPNQPFIDNTSQAQQSRKGPEDKRGGPPTDSIPDANRNENSNSGGSKR